MLTVNRTSSYLCSISHRPVHPHNLLETQRSSSSPLPALLSSQPRDPRTPRTLAFSGALSTPTRLVSSCTRRIVLSFSSPTFF